MSKLEEYPVNRSDARYIFVILFLLYVFDYIDRMTIAALFPYIKAAWKLSDTQCGMLSSVVTITMTIFAFPISVLVDRWSRTKMIGLMSLLWGIAAAACSFATNFRQLLSLRAIIGVGEAAYTSGGFAMIAAYYPRERRAFMSGLFSSAAPLGMGLGLVLGGYIAVHLGWQYAFGLTALPGILVALLFFRVKDYKTIDVAQETNSSQKLTSGRRLWKAIAVDFIKTPSLIFNYGAFVCNTFVIGALTSWLPTYFHRTEGLPMDKAGLKTSAIFLLAVIGAPLGGWLADRWSKTRLNARMVFPAISSALMALSLFCAFVLASGQLQSIFLLFYGITVPMFVSAASAVTQDVVHPGHRAMSYSVSQVFQMLLGYSLSPLFVGFISDRYDLLTAFQFLPIFGLMGALLFYFGSLFYERDLHKVERFKIVLE